MNSWSRPLLVSGHKGKQADPRSTLILASFRTQVHGVSPFCLQVYSFSKHRVATSCQDPEGSPVPSDHSLASLQAPGSDANTRQTFPFSSLERLSQSPANPGGRKKEMGGAASARAPGLPAGDAHSKHLPR